jgi:hypothetical protein
MAQALQVPRPEHNKSAANFRREILPPVEVENVGKRLPGYSFGRLCKALWPQKTPSSIEFYTGMPERTARHVAADKSDPHSVALAKIIDSEQGWRALRWIMRGSKQAWWLDVVEAYEAMLASDARRTEIREQMKML